jgi:hypothetical protein
MSTVTLPARTDGQTIDETWFNKLREALYTDLVPRNSSGIATDVAGSLGDSTYGWLKAFIKSGYWKVGDIKMHHSFNGTVTPGHGWMKCDGRQITESAYNTEHGANTWATYIGSSDLLNKYLPNMTGRYPVGVATTTQTGSGAITAVGNTSHQVNLQHTHSVPDHVHEWLDTNGNSGDGADLSTTSGAANGIDYTATDAIVGSRSTAGVTGGVGTSGNGGSTTQSIQPESIELEFYMRII